MVLLKTLKACSLAAKKLVLAAAVATLAIGMQATANQADVDIESEKFRLHEVHQATRKVQVGGAYYPVKLSARVHLPDGEKVGLEELKPPAAVRLELDEQEQVTDIHVLAFF